MYHLEYHKQTGAEYILMSNFLHAALIILSLHGIADADIVTFKDLRDERIQKQQLDFSCGAASVATVLRSYYGIDVTENDILNLLDDDNRYTFRDLANVVAKWNFHGVGMEIGFSDLKNLKIPAIAYIRYRETDHFTVIRGMSPGIVQLADPAFGNRRFRDRLFRKYWEQDSGSGRILIIIPDSLSLFPVREGFFLEPKNFLPMLQHLFSQNMSGMRFRHVH